MQITIDQKKFGNFILLFLLDNLLKDNVVLSTNKPFRAVVDLMKKNAGFKQTILKAFLDDISIEERNNYAKIKDSFHDKSYKSGNYINLIGNESKNKEKQ